MDGKRVSAFAAAAVAGLVVAITWRIDTSAILALSGVCVGLVIGVPMGAAGMYFVQRARQQEREQWRRRGMIQSGQSPVVIVPPYASAPQLPYGPGWSGSGDMSPAPARQFTVIGDGEDEG